MDFLLPTIIGGDGAGGIELDGNITGGDHTDADKQLAAVLLQLPRLIFESDSLFIWGVGNKKKRTARRRRVGRDTKKVSEISDVSAATPSPEASSTSKQCPEGSSPDTPLIFSLSPDQKPITKRKAVRRRREDYVLLITQLEKEKESLKREIEDFQRKRDDAIVANALLKRKREELILAQKREKMAKLEEVNTDLTLGIQCTLPTSTALSSSSTAVSASSVQSRGGLGATIDQHHPLILYRTDKIADNGNSVFPAEMRSLLLKVNVGPKQLPDLNDPAEEGRVSTNPQPLDLYLDKKAMATLARQKRRRIQKSKTLRRRV